MLLPAGVMDEMELRSISSMTSFGQQLRKTCLVYFRYCYNSVCIFSLPKSGNVVLVLLEVTLHYTRTCTLCCFCDAYKIYAKTNIIRRAIHDKVHPKRSREGPEGD